MSLKLNGTTGVEGLVNLAEVTATGSTTARTLANRFADVVNVKDFGADPTGVVDSSTAFQNALNLIQAKPNGGTLFIPSGNYLVNTTLTYSNNSLSIVGEGEKITIITKTTGTDLFIFNGIKNPSIANECSTLHVTGITFVAGKSSSGAGSAIKAIWPESMLNSFCCDLENLHFRPLDGNGANYWWDNCINIRNASQTRIVNIVSNFGNSFQATHIRLDYSNQVSNYVVLIDRLYLYGGLYGIHQTGCVENVMIYKGEIVGCLIGVFMDASTSLISNPIFDVKDIHINSRQWCIKTIKWDGIHISGVDFYHGVGGGSDVDGGNISLNQGNIIRITNNKFQSPLSLPIQNIGLHLTNIDKAIISGNIFIQNTFRNIFIENSTKIAVESNAFYSSLFPIENCIRIENIIPPITDPSKVRIIGNTFENAIYGIWIEGGLSDVDVLGNTFDDISGVPIMLDNPRIYGQQIAIQNNKSIAWERRLLELNSATPSVSGAQEGLCYFQNSSATTITNFVDSYASQIIDIESVNGNTTIQHNANIRLQGGVDFVMSNGNRLYLKKEDAASGSSWYEIGRLT